MLVYKGRDERIEGMRMLSDVHRLIKSQEMSARLKVTLSVQKMDGIDGPLCPTHNYIKSAIVRKDEQDFCLAC